MTEFIDVDVGLADDDSVMSIICPVGVLSSLRRFLHMQSFSGLAQLFWTVCVRC